jgi:ABC-type polysaccharide/polyol phosphate transport system ATPase subunit
VSANIIECRNVWKTFRMHPGQRLLRRHFATWLKKDPTTEFHALKDVSVNVARGEGLAIIGGNGAGKTTLLSVLTGLAQPDRGTVQMNGRAAALLELGSGFHPDLTGLENVFLNAALLGFTERETKAMLDSIIDFAGLRDFIHEPLRTYSSGMNLRLAFSIAVNVDPEILIIDEVLAVGDQDFQAKCYERIQRFRRAGKSFLCVSHSKAVLMDLCDRAVLLDHGQVIAFGKIADVFEQYECRATLIP